MSGLPPPKQLRPQCCRCRSLFRASSCFTGECVELMMAIVIAISVLNSFICDFCVNESGGSFDVAGIHCIIFSGKPITQTIFQSPSFCLGISVHFHKNNFHVIRGRVLLEEVSSLIRADFAPLLSVRRFLG